MIRKRYLANPRPWICFPTAVRLYTRPPGRTGTLPPRVGTRPLRRITLPVAPLSHAVVRLFLSGPLGRCPVGSLSRDGGEPRRPGCLQIVRGGHERWHVAYIGGVRLNYGERLCQGLIQAQRIPFLPPPPQLVFRLVFVLGFSCKFCFDL
jgi:hypothetical protein